MNYRASGTTNQQLGFVSYPRGRFQSLTSDTHGFLTLSLSADGKSMVSVQGQESDSVFLQPLTTKGEAVTVPGLPNQAELRGVGWDKDGDLIVTTTTSILRMSPDGGRENHSLN